MSRSFILDNGCEQFTTSDRKLMKLAVSQGFRLIGSPGQPFLVFWFWIKAARLCLWLHDQSRRLFGLLCKHCIDRVG